MARQKRPPRQNAVPQVRRPLAPGEIDLRRRRPADLKKYGLNSHLQRLVADFGLQRVRAAIAEFEVAEAWSPLVPYFGLEHVRAAMAKFEISEAWSGPPQKPGRPSTDVEDRELAEWIYSRAEKYRRAGKRNGVQLAEIDRYHFELDDAQRKRLPFTKWQKRHKEKRLRGLQAWRSAPELGELDEELAEALGLGRAMMGPFQPHWRDRYIK